MDVIDGLGQKGVIDTIEMHTSGEPTRIVVAGYPVLEGRTLLEKRTDARNKYDSIRTRLMREPRGHADMYGAILVNDTELTDRGEADIGVLFCHNEGYSTMCGHATIALGRFLVDTQDTKVFPRRKQLNFDSAANTTVIRLHAPCGLVHVRVPTKDGIRSDAGLPVTFRSVPSFASAVNVSVPIPIEQRWATLRALERESVTVDVAYGGAFYAIVSCEQLGFPLGLGGGYQMREFDEATKILKSCLSSRRELFQHPDTMEPRTGYFCWVNNQFICATVLRLPDIH
ncbi:hypothetical protein PLICRDRAFT_37079 [Plicaturopsis crispa FD-325 SS-3]|nr:hypothetical protein PLICRDRAFT_37079 [Plicaturopsis crispa FD-325 SS-3]